MRPLRGLFVAACFGFAAPAFAAKTAGPEVLFVCTGNYYRSRYAEAVFNEMARQAGLEIRAESRGIDTSTKHQPLEISPIVENELKRLGIPVDRRVPAPLKNADLVRARNVMVLDEVEHRPMMKKRFPAWETRVRYLHVADRVGPDLLPSIHREVAQLAKAKLEERNARLWKLHRSEGFEKPLEIKTSWKPETYGKSDDRYSDDGAYFHEKVKDFKRPEKAFRAAVDFGQEGWLRVEAYSRSENKAWSDLFAIEADPSAPSNRALRVRTPEHTDALVLRSAQPLPPEYRICLKVGHARYGTGAGDGNGYNGDEKAEPWKDAPATGENGFYWLAILDAPPMPHNNTWIHHHRKAVLDSDNNFYPEKNGGSWTRLWNGEKFVADGRHPLMAFVLDRNNREKVWNYDRTGQPFVSWAKGAWNSEAETGEIRAVDAYKDATWYEACLWKRAGRFGLEASGDFAQGGETLYAASIEASKVFRGGDSPEYFMAGDPHINHYEGQVFYDDLRLYLPR